MDEDDPAEHFLGFSGNLHCCSLSSPDLSWSIFLKSVSTQSYGYSLLLSSSPVSTGMLASTKNLKGCGPINEKVQEVLNYSCLKGKHMFFCYH